MPDIQQGNGIDKEYIAAVLCLSFVRPKEAFIAVTYLCNARCGMCNIWKSERTPEIEPMHYSKLPKSLRTVNITGGEPFLRKDLVEVIRAIDGVMPSGRLVFSTNGYLTETIIKRVEAIQSFHRRIGVGVSIDGLGKTHDKIRGVVGIYDHAIDTVRALKARGLTDLRIAMTIQEDNLGEIEQVFDLSRSLGVEFTMTLAHNSEVYFKKTDNRLLRPTESSAQAISGIMRSQLTSRSVKEWFRAYHTMGMLNADHRKAFASRCEAGRRYFFMSPSGDIYPCNVMDKRLGNITQVPDWDSLFTPEVESELRASVRACRSDCWMICNTKSLIVSHPLRAASWVAGSKLRAHLRS